MTENYVLDYSPSAVQHLGLGLYKQLPQALAELITNSWDADATRVKVVINYSKREISVSDNGHGMTHDELNTNFLKIARNRRLSENKMYSPKGRKVTGKKGLGKLALFGIANRIKVFSTKGGFENGFVMSYTAIKNTPDNQRYNPETIHNNRPTISNAGTTIIIEDLTLKTITPLKKLHISLAKRFNGYHSEDFLVTLQDENNNTLILDENNFEESIKPRGEGNLEFTYRFPEDFKKEIEKNVSLKELDEKQISGAVFTKKTPLKDEEQGFSVLAHGKIASEQKRSQFGGSANDNFYQYAVGYFNMDVIDDSIEEDYISTDRQSIIWNSTEDLMYLRSNVYSLLRIIQNRWREDRKKVKENKMKKAQTDNININKILTSDNLVKSDQNTINTITEVLEDDSLKINDGIKNKILKIVATSTETYKIDNSVYKELIPSDFEVPQKINSKIRRIREEAIRAATSKEDQDKFIITQGLLLRAIIENTTSLLLTTKSKELSANNLWVTQRKTDTEVKIKNLSFEDKYTTMLSYFEFTKEINLSLHTSMKDSFLEEGVDKKLSQLMHDPSYWPTFVDLKRIWDLVAPNLKRAYAHIEKKNE